MRDLKLLPLFACGIVTVGVIEQWQYVGTSQWWFMFGVGSVWGGAYAVERGFGWLFAAWACVLFDAGLLGWGNDLHGADRASFSAVAVGVLSALAMERIRRWVAGKGPEVTSQ
jgi:hypothetical protein